MKMEQNKFEKTINRFSIFEEMDAESLYDNKNKRMNDTNNENVSRQSEGGNKGLIQSTLGDKPESTLTLWFTRVCLTIGVIMLLAILIGCWKPLWVLARLPYFVVTGYLAKRRWWSFLPFTSVKVGWFSKLAGAVCTLLMWVASVSWVALIV